MTTVISVTLYFYFQRLRWRPTEINLLSLFVYVSYNTFKFPVKESSLSLIITKFIAYYYIANYYLYFNVGISRE